ncbi:M48 family metalloprotease [bacterium]|nr:M48 family metalloprotease [bacterium]
MKYVHLCIITLWALLLTACSTPQIRFAPGEIPHPPPSTVEEIAAGEQVKSSFLKDIPLEEDPAYTKRVERVLRRLLAVTPSSGHWPTYVLDHDLWNAMTTTGNYIFVFRGLLDDLKKDDELAAVLAHEISHRLAKHHEKTSEEKWKSALRDLTTVAAGILVASSEHSTQRQVGEMMNTTHQVMSGLTTNPYSQTREREADLVGLFLMADAGYDPYASAKLWRDQAEKTGAVGVSSAFFSTHPPSSERSHFAFHHAELAEKRYKQAKRRGPPKLKPPRKRYEPTYKQEMLYKQAFDLHRGGQYEDALAKTKQLQRLAPRYDEATSLHAVNLAKVGKLAESEKLLKKLIMKNPHDSQARYNLACVSALRGKKEYALQHLDAAVDIDPGYGSFARDDPDFSSLENTPEFLSITKERSLPVEGERGRNTFTINNR